jgi:hypothetical protein
MGQSASTLKDLQTGGSIAGYGTESLGLASNRSGVQLLGTYPVRATACAFETEDELNSDETRRLPR